MNGRQISGVAAILFSMACVGVASGSIVPVAYGVGEASTSVTVTSVISSLMALISGGGGLWALLGKVGGALGITSEKTDLVQKTINDVTGDLKAGDYLGVAENAAMVALMASRAKKKDVAGFKLISEYAAHVWSFDSTPKPLA